MVQQQRLTNIGGYIGTLESTTFDNQTIFCRFDRYTEPRRLTEVVGFFKRKFNSKNSIPIDMWLDGKAKVTSIQFDTKYQILRLKISKA